MVVTISTNEKHPTNKIKRDNYKPLHLPLNRFSVADYSDALPFERSCQIKRSHAMVRDT